MLGFDALGSSPLAALPVAAAGGGALQATSAISSACAASLTTGIQLSAAVRQTSIAFSANGGPASFATMFVRNSSSLWVGAGAGISGRTYTSSNNYSSVTLTTGLAFGVPTDLQCFNDVFYLLDGSATVYTSTDGVAWVASYTAPVAVNTIAYDGTTYVLAGAATSNLLRKTTNFSTWTTATMPSTLFWACVRYVNGRFIVTTNTTAGAYSTDGGATWNSATIGTPGSNVVFGNGMYVVSTSSTSYGYSVSTDGVNWTAYTTVQAQSITFTGMYFVAVRQTQDSAGMSVYASTDCTSWVAYDPWSAWGTRYVAAVDGSTVIVSGEVNSSTGFMRLSLTNLASTATATATIANVANFTATISAQSTALSASLTTAINLNAVTSASTVISGADLATQVKLATSIAAATTATAGLSTSISLASPVTSVSTITGAITTGISLAAATSAVSTATSAVTTAIQLAATATSVVTAASSMVGGAAQLAAAVSVATSVTAPLTTSFNLQGSLSVAATASNSVTTAIQLAADAFDSPNIVTAQLLTGLQLSASAGAVSTAAASLSTGIPLAATSTATSTATAAVSTVISLSAAISVATTVTATASQGAALVGTITSVSATAGDLTTGIALAGAPTVVSTVAAGLTTQQPVTATCVVTVSATAGLTTGIFLAAAQGTSLTTTAGLATGIALAGAVGATALAQGSVTTQISLATTASVSSSLVSGVLSNSISYNVSDYRANLIYELALLHGLVKGAPLTVGPNTRTAGALVQNIDTDPSGTVTVSTVSSDVLQGNLNDWIDALAAIHGLTSPLVVTPIFRSSGSLSQSMNNSNGNTTVTTL